MIITPSKLLSISLVSLALLFSNTVFSAPVIDAPEQGRIGEAVQFEAARSDAGAKEYLWEIQLNDGTGTPVNHVETVSTLSHKFNAVGEYKVTLTVNGSSLVKIITILDANASVTIAATFDAVAPAGAEYLAGDVVTFNSTDVSGNNNWDFGDLANARLNQQQTPKVPHVEIGLEGNNDRLSTVTHIFTAPGTYTVTLANQTDFPSSALKALTSTYTKDIIIGGVNQQVVRGASTLYDDHCANCHGLRERDAAGNYTMMVNLGEFSFLAQRAQTTPFVDQEISDALQNVPLMRNIDQLQGAGEITKITDFINLLVPNTKTPQTGKQLYTAQCSRCHGKGDGAYARSVVGATVTEIEAAINNPAIPDMQTVPKDATSLQLIATFLASGTLLPQPTTGDGLYIMYCSYCHGLDGVGGPYTDDSIAGTGLTGFQIMSEINKQDSRNMMDRLVGKINDSEAAMIATTLNGKNPTPKADENDND